MKNLKIQNVDIINTFAWKIKKSVIFIPLFFKLVLKKSYHIGAAITTLNCTPLASTVVSVTTGAADVEL